MTRKSAGGMMAGVKKASCGNHVASVRKGAKPGAVQKVTKDASNFLKQRMGTKLKHLRPASQASGDNSAMADGAASAGGLTELLSNAAERGEQFIRDGGEEEGEGEDEEAYENTCREAENNRRRFYTELRKVLAQADVIIEVLDARDPASCRSEALEREVLGAGKRLVLLLNKIDLVPKSAVEAWTRHLQRSFPTIAFKAAHGGAQRATHAMTSAANASEGLLKSTHAVVGADELMQLIKNYSRMGGGKMKGHVSVGIVGYPNTGKSSVINSMKRYSAVEAGGRAGVTKLAQEVKLDSKVTLIDSPGVVFEGDSDDPAVVLRNAVRVEGVADPVGVVDALLRKAPAEATRSFYGLQADPANVDEFLAHVARSRGKLRRGSGLDLASAAKSVITDWTTGKFRYYVLPPSASSVENMEAVERETAEIVTQLAPSFDIDALLTGADARAPVLGAPAMSQGDDAMDEDEEVLVHVDMQGGRR